MKYIYRWYNGQISIVEADSVLALAMGNGCLGCTLIAFVME